jgi:hypothetical protein
MLRTAAVVALVSCLLLTGCGSDSNPGSITPKVSVPSPGSPNPVPNPNPSTGPDTYLAQLFVSAGKTPVSQGQVTVNSTANNGFGTVQVTNFSMVTTYVLQFCPYPQAFTNCMNVTSVTTDASGNATTNFTFPQKGTFAGSFQLVSTSGGQVAATGAGSTGTNFMSALLPASSITGGINQTTGSAPGSGSITVTNTMGHLALTGTLPNHTFNVEACSLFLSTACTRLANVTTDAQGNLSTDIGSIQAAGWSVFRLTDANGVQLISAFRVQ